MLAHTTLVSVCFQLNQHKIVVWAVGWCMFSMFDHVCVINSMGECSGCATLGQACKQQARQRGMYLQRRDDGLLM